MSTTSAFSSEPEKVLVILANIFFPMAKKRSTKLDKKTLAKMT